MGKSHLKCTMSQSIKSRYLVKMLVFFFLKCHQLYSLYKYETNTKQGKNSKCCAYYPFRGQNLQQCVFECVCLCVCVCVYVREREKKELRQKIRYNPSRFKTSLMIRKLFSRGGMRKISGISAFRRKPNRKQQTLSTLSTLSTLFHCI